MYVCIYIYIDMYLSLSIYIYIYTCMNTYIYIYICGCGGLRDADGEALRPNGRLRRRDRLL